MQNSDIAYKLAGNKFERHPNNEETTSDEPMGIL
jgi:hypothetical protein